MRKIRYDLSLVAQNILTISVMKQPPFPKPGPYRVFDPNSRRILIILSKIYPRSSDYDYIYLGDNARTSYGTRSFEIVYDLPCRRLTNCFEMVAT